MARTVRGNTMHGFLPSDVASAELLGRMDFGDGPTPVLVRHGRVLDLSAVAPTVADLLNSIGPGGPIEGRDCGAFEANQHRPRWDGGRRRLLAPIDLRAVRPGSVEAARLKAALIADGLWSQYLEVAIGPFVRLFDEHFTLDHIRRATVRLEIVGQAMDAHHQYPDGFAIFLGTLFAPTQDRDAPGKGFTHHVGDIVRISNAGLGVLENRVGHCDELPPWQFGIGALMRNLARRGLLRREE